MAYSRVIPDRANGKLKQKWLTALVTFLLLICDDRQLNKCETIFHDARRMNCILYLNGKKYTRRVKCRNGKMPYKLLNSITLLSKTILTA